MKIFRQMPNLQSPAKHAFTTNALPEGSSNGRYRIALKKPLGIVLQQETGRSAIYVESLVEGGSAKKLGMVSEGDQLISTSGVIYTKTQEYSGTTVRGGLQVVQMNVLNESFDAVMAAIGSHPGHIPVELEFERAETQLELDKTE